MSFDEMDKTVFKQPLPGGDRTVLRGRATRPGPPLTPAVNPTSPARDVTPIHRPAEFRSRMGLNPLVQAASTLIAVFAKTRHALNHADVAGLHQRLGKEIKNFEETAREQGIKPEVVLSTRYLLCTVLDEAVMNTPWGSESAWSQRSLLSTFHGETSGGEKSFLILQRMRQAPADNLDFIELFYICVCLGFEGKFRVASGGRDQLLHIKDELFETIRRYRGDYERTLAGRWQGLASAGRSLSDHLPMWVVASGVAALLFFGYSGFRYWLHSSASPVLLELSDIATVQESEKP